MPFLDSADFLGTLTRMYTDAKLLYEHGEYYNACYLSGYVLECALKYLLCTYATKGDGTNYTVEDVSAMAHKTNKLNETLENWISFSSGIHSCYRMDPASVCPYIFLSHDGYPRWNPKYRYGEHPKWHTSEWSAQYISDINNIFDFISSVVTGG